MKTMDKRVVVNLPEDIYITIKRAADRHYKSLSAWIREIIIEQVEEELSEEELAIIKKSEQEIREGKKGADWRKVRR